MALHKLGVVSHASNPGTQEVDVGGSEIYIILGDVLNLRLSGLYPIFKNNELLLTATKFSL